MRCGAKRYVAEIEYNGETKIKSVNARTPAEARKFIREEYGKKTQIYSVQEERSLS